MSASDIAYIIFFIICILLSAYFAGTEIAFMSLQRFRLEAMLQKKRRGARLVAWLKDHPETFLSTVLLGNNLVNIAAASLGTAVAINLLGEQTGVIVSTFSGSPFHKNCFMDTGSFCDFFKLDNLQRQPTDRRS